MLRSSCRGGSTRMLPIMNRCDFLINVDYLKSVFPVKRVTVVVHCLNMKYFNK